MAAPTAPSAAVSFGGVAPVLVNTQVVFQAIDAAQFITLTQFVAVTSTLPDPVDNFVFRSDCWNGGIEGVGALVTGTFRWGGAGSWRAGRGVGRGGHASPRGDGRG